MLVFTGVYVCVKAKLTVVSFFFLVFFCTFPLWIPFEIIDIFPLGAGGNITIENCDCAESCEGEEKTKHQSHFF